MRTRRVTVVPYDPQWVEDFENIKREITCVLADRILTVEHVGSTAVAGLPAKPIIDLDVVIANASALPPVIQGLAAIGYIHEGNLGIEGREAFRYEGKPHLRKHHLYVCPQDSKELHRHLTFRDYLRTHPEAAAEYGRTKLLAAQLYPEDIDAYMEHKSSCIQTLYEKCGL